MYVGVRGTEKARYTDPAALEWLDKKTSDREFVPSDWASISFAKESLGFSDFRAFKQVLASYRASHPSEFKHYLNGANQFKEHISRRLIEQIRVDRQGKTRDTNSRS